jgi:hypothetical protein
MGPSVKAQTAQTPLSSGRWPATQLWPIRFAIAMQAGEGGWQAILKVYDDDDRAILSGILGFWFVNRTLTRPGSLK